MYQIHVNLENQLLLELLFSLSNILRYPNNNNNNIKSDSDSCYVVYEGLNNFSSENTLYTAYTIYKYLLLLILLTW